MTQAQSHDPYAPQERPFTFDHVPSLLELLPDTGGHPGCEYAIVSTERARKAQDEGWHTDPNYPQIFTIEGEKGEMDLQLWRRGKPIPGASSSSGARKLVADFEIPLRTGVEIPGQPPLSDAKPEAKAKATA